MSKNIRLMVYAGAYVAFMFLISLTIGFIHIGPFSFTIMPIFVALATWHIGWLGGFVTSLTFGFCSYIINLIIPSLGSIIFYNHPEAAILPRVAMGIVIVLIIKFMGEISKVKYIASVFLAFAFNTIFVIGFLQIVRTYDGNISKLGVLLKIVYANILIETLAMPVISFALYRYTKWTRKNFINRNKYSW